MRAAARANRDYGLSPGSIGYVRRFAAVAREIDRTVNAVRKRAGRIGAHSYGAGRKKRGALQGAPFEADSANCRFVFRDARRD